MTEVELITTMLQHPAGFDIELCGGMLCARSTEQGIYCVSWGNFLTHECEFNAASEAARFFVAKRRELELGADIELALNGEAKL